MTDSKRSFTLDIPQKVDREWMLGQMETTMKEQLNVDIAGFGDDDWLPTPHGLTMAIALAKNPGFNACLEGKDVLELGSGVGNHTVLIARQNPKSLVCTEISQSRIGPTSATMKLNNCDEKHVKYIVADWLSVDGKFDCVITNPPFCKSGKRNRRYFIDELILNGHKVLRPNGLLIFIQSSMANLPMTKDRLKQNGFELESIAERTFPWRDYYFQDQSFLAESEFEGAYSLDPDNDNRRLETLYVIKARLVPWSSTFGH